MKITESQAGLILKNATQMAVADASAGRNSRPTIESNVREILDAMSHLDSLIEDDLESGSSEKGDVSHPPDPMLE